MADADSNEPIPEQDGLQGAPARSSLIARRIWPKVAADDAVPAATLLSLPTELLAKIGWSLAPLGGKEAANLRLVFRQLANAVAPMVWSSLSFAGAANVDIILSEAWRGRSKHHMSTTSIYYPLPFSLPCLPLTAIQQLFPALRHLHLVAPPAGRQNNFLPSLDEVARDTIRLLPRLSSLRLDGFSFHQDYSFRTWAPSVRDLVLVDCEETDDMFSQSEEERNTVLAPHLDSLKILGSSFHATYEAVVAILAMAFEVTLRPRVVVSIPKVELRRPGVGETLESLSWNAQGEIVGITHFSFKGLPDLFNKTSASNHIDTVSFVVQVIGAERMTTVRELSLPVLTAFDVNDAFTTLHAPNVSTLLPYPPATNRLSSEILPSVVQLLTKESFPILNTLRLRGWLDAADFSALALAAASPRSFAREYLVLFDLLGFLCAVELTELRLEYSEGHSNEEVQCIFRSEGVVGAEWEVGLVRVS